MEKMSALVKLVPVNEYAKVNVFRSGLLPRFEVGHPSWIVSMYMFINLLKIAKEGAGRGSYHDVRLAGM